MNKLGEAETFHCFGLDIFLYFSSALSTFISPKVDANRRPLLLLMHAAASSPACLFQSPQCQFRAQAKSTK